MNAESLMKSFVNIQIGGCCASSADTNTQLSEYVITVTTLVSTFDVLTESLKAHD
jgi:hypothetical protein